MAYDYEYKTPLQVDYGWGITFNATGKIPIVSKRIFETMEHALAYVNNPDDSAIPGIIISVINDPVTDNNGPYFVNKVADESGMGGITKVGSEIQDPFDVVGNILLTNRFFNIVDGLLVLN